MSERFVVEADRRVVGVAVRDVGGFRFYSANPDYLCLEGRTFARAKTLARSVARIARHRRRGEEAGPAAEPSATRH